jgi:hypothetical protein
MEVGMPLKFRMDDLSPAEASLIGWQFGFDDDDDPFLPTLWQTIARAWASDAAPMTSARQRTHHLKRLGAPGAYPEEVAVYLKFKSSEGETYWLDMLRRAGLGDRRQRSSAPPATERRRRA